MLPDNILVIIILFTGILSLVFALSLLIKKNRKTSNTLMAFLFLCWGLIQIRVYFAVTGTAVKYPILFFLHFPVIFCIAPLVYLNFRALLVTEFKINIRNSLHFIVPFLLMIIDIILLLANPQEYFAAVICGIIAIFFNLQSPASIKPMLAVIITGCTYQAAYEIAIIKSLSALSSIQEANRKKRKLFIILFASVIPLTIPQIIIIIALLTGSKIYYLFAIAVISAFVLSVYFLIQRYMDIPQNLMLDIRRRRYERSLLAGINIENLRNSLANIMEKDKVFREDTITLGSLSGKLNITPHQLSEFINEQFNINFNGYINQYRVTEAKKILAENKDNSVLDIAYSVGFNTKSAFNSAFRKFAGMTPVDYRREQADK